MELLNRIKAFLFDPGATPSPTWGHDQLGDTEWCEDEEAWRGTSDGLTFLLAYERDSEVPPPEVVKYALEILGADFELIPRFESFKQKMLPELPSKFHDEIAALSLESVHFYRDTPKCSAIACLSGGIDGRHWRFDMLGADLSNLGFDS